MRSCAATGPQNPKQFSAWGFSSVQPRPVDTVDIAWDGLLIAIWSATGDRQGMLLTIALTLEVLFLEVLSAAALGGRREIDGRGALSAENSAPDGHILCRIPDLAGRRGTAVIPTRKFQINGGRYSVTKQSDIPNPSKTASPEDSYFVILSDE